MTLCQVKTPVGDAYLCSDDASPASLTLTKTEHGHPSGTRVTPTKPGDASSIALFICARTHMRAQNRPTKHASPASPADHQ